MVLSISTHNSYYFEIYIYIYVYYLLPKIHKGLSSVKGRPVISNCGTITGHISEYLDDLLNPLVSLSRSYVKDTNHLLSKLSKLNIIREGLYGVH